jgi:protein required for attachment to host cells
MKALILVADAGKARLFASEGQEPWTLLEQREHPEVRSERGSLASDQPGRTQERMADGRRSSMEPPTPLKRIEAEKFAAQLAASVEAASARGEYDRVVIAAAPRFLGSLRQHLSDTLTRRHEVITIDKDLSALADVELPGRIAGELELQ